MDRKMERRSFVLASGAAVAAASGLAGCTTTTNSGNSATTAPTTTTYNFPHLTRTDHTSITATPQNGVFTFVNNTNHAVCSLELENAISGERTEMLGRPNTHEILKPHYKFTYDADDYSWIDEKAVYHVHATTCKYEKTATARDWTFERGWVWTINEW